MLRRRAWLVAAGPLAVLFALLTAQPARGLDLNKKYEEALVSWALDTKTLEYFLGSKRLPWWTLIQEPNPEGKIIDRIEIVREDIIARSDPWPNLLNRFHMKTRDHIVRQELLVVPGQRWNQKKVDESARNLRQMHILAVVRTIPLQSSRPGHVTLLVVTKDLWSIRMNTVFAQVGTVLEVLDWTPTEQNFLGRNKRISLHLGLRQLDWENVKIRDRMKVGQLYVDQRLLGSRLKLVEWFDAVIAGDVPCGGAIGSQSDVWCPESGFGALEGAYGQLQIRRPLYSLSTKWGFAAWGEVNIYQMRKYRFNSNARVPRGEAAGLSLKTATNSDDPQQPAVPRVYNIRNLTFSANVTRSFGLQTKHDLTTGLTGYSYRYSTPDNLPFNQATIDWYTRNFLPRSEDALFAFLSYRTYSPRYVRLRNVRGFALSEDYVLGYDLSVEARAALDLQDAAHSFVSLLFNARYRWYFHENMLTLWATGRSRLQPGLAEMGYRELGFRGTWADSLFTVGCKNTSPPVLWGRLHFRLFAKLRHNDLDQERTFLGGSTNIDITGALAGLEGEAALRGYPSAHFEGDNLFQLNLEYRSRPINLFTLHLGFVAFYDGGGVFGGPVPADRSRELSFRYHHSVGVGIRGHFPQFDKESLRADFAIPLTDEAGEVGTWFSFSFRQVF